MCLCHLAKLGEIQAPGEKHFFLRELLGVKKHSLSMSVRSICSVVENRTWGAYNGESVATLGEDETLGG